MPRKSKPNLVACQFFVVQKRQRQPFCSFSVGVLSFCSCYYCSFPLPLLLRPRPHVSSPISAALSSPSAGSFAEQRLVIELTRGMTSDRGQNRYLLFMDPQTLLRFENCSSSYCLPSSWRRFHVFKSCRSFVSWYCFLWVTTGLSCCREIFLSL